MTEKKANDYQVAGEHYRNTTIQHWDFAASNKFDYFQGQITKYVTRWKNKNGLADLEKAAHFLQKYIEEHKKFSPAASRLDDIPKSKVYKIGQEHPFGFDAGSEI